VKFGSRRSIRQLAQKLKDAALRCRLPPEMHDFLRTVTVAPMTTGSQAAPYRIPLRFRGKEGLILLDQLRTLDKRRLVHRLGAVTGSTLRLTLAALREMFEE
jgi:mRNA interferase MazF